MTERFDLSPLESAVRRLTEGLARYEGDIADTQIRDGLIQRFEFTYELSHKMLKRYLESVSPSPDEVDRMPFADLVRSGTEQGLLLSDWASWKNFRAMRAMTSHVYNEGIALEVVHGIPAFLAEAEFLLQQLQERTS
uniref:Nucleotidyltransferase substrate binding protein like protein n=1 Tax=mine drainage metagenome TaxID=410659 RepID=E6PF34_9ZZZZ